MTPDEARAIVTHIENEKIYSSIDFKTYLDSTGLVQTNQDMIKIIHEIVKQDLFHLNFIKEYIPKCTSMTSDFYELIINISENNNTYHWLDFLKVLHIENPNNSKWLIKKLELQKSENIATPLGYLYGGLGLKDLARVFNRISEHSTKVQKLAYMVAVGILSERRTKIPANEIDYIINLSKSDSFSIKRTAIYTLARFCAATKKAQNQLISLANTHDDIIRRIIISSTWSMTDTHPNLVNEILIICSETKDPNIRETVMMLLKELVSSHPSEPEYPLTAIKIIKKWSQESDFGFHITIGLIFSATDKIQCIHKFMKAWINEEENMAMRLVILPSIIARIYSSQKNHTHFVNLLKELDLKNETISRMICEVLKNFLSDKNAIAECSNDILGDCEKIITNIARHSEIDITPNRIITNPRYKLMDMIKNIEIRNKHRPQQAKENWEKFPTLVEMLTRSRLEKILRKDPHHPLIKLLSDLSIPPKDSKKLKTTTTRLDLYKQHYSYAMIADIEESLKQLFEKPNDVPRTIQAGFVSDGTRFYKVLSELNAASRLKRRHNIEFNPKITDGKNLDIKAKSKNGEVLFEVTNPQGHFGLKYLRSTQTVKNMIREKNIIDKIDTQLKHAEANKLPIVLIIDNTDSHEIDAEQVFDVFYGTPQLQLGYVDGEVVSEEYVHGKDSIYDTNENSHLLSAIILLKRKYDHDSIKINVVGKIFLAPAATHPLNKEIISDIKLSFDECQTYYGIQ